MENTLLSQSSPLVPRRTSILVAIIAAAVSTLWLLGTPAGVMGKAVAVGYAICHRIAERSFLIDGLPMPLCARCTGIYLGVMAGYLVAVARDRAKARGLPPAYIIAILIGFILLMGIDGVNSYLHLFPGFVGLYQPNNTLRLVTGVLCGLAIIHLLLPIFNGVVWANPNQGRSLDGWRDLAAVGAVAGVVVLLVLSERPLILWVLGMVSSFGVVMLLSMIGAVLFLSINRLDRAATNWRDLVIPMMAGLSMALVQMGAITIVRFALTGTWDGFAIG